MKKSDFEDEVAFEKTLSMKAGQLSDSVVAVMLFKDDKAQFLIVEDGRLSKELQEFIDAGGYERFQD